ncbi:sodium-dependent multivitamin transporter-like [Liolophura sinensis]|uniref:sodium-dependent multivitamin transporter-like n=1 Tax=Liolophura sinensis TaxID=3198878 RepID=UPI0031593A12
MVMAYGGPITQVGTALLGSLDGPMTGVFLAGAFLPWANSKGALAGGLSGVGMCMWITLGAQLTGIQSPWLPLGGTDSCPTNVTGSLSLFSNSSADRGFKTPESCVGLEKMYALSFTTYSSVGVIVAVVVCIVVSAITGFTNPREVNPLCLSHFIRGYFFTGKETDSASEQESCQAAELMELNPRKDSLERRKEEDEAFVRG